MDDLYCGYKANSHRTPISPRTQTKRAEPKVELGPVGTVGVGPARAAEKGRPSETQTGSGSRGLVAGSYESQCAPEAELTGSECDRRQRAPGAGVTGMQVHRQRGLAKVVLHGRTTSFLAGQNEVTSRNEHLYGLNNAIGSF